MDVGELESESRSTGAQRPRRVTSRIPGPEPIASVPGMELLLSLLVLAIPIGAVILFGAVEPEHVLPLETVALVLGAAALVRRQTRGASVLPVPEVTLPVLLLALLPGLQLLRLPAEVVSALAPGLARLGVHDLRTISVYPHVTAVALVRWGSYSAFLIAALELVRRRQTITIALATIGLLGVVEAIYGIGNLFLGNRYLLWIPRAAFEADASGTLVNRNHFAALLVLALPVLLARRWLGRASSSRGDEIGGTVLYLVATTPIGLAILLSHSRAGVLCLALSLVLAGMLAPSDRIGRRSRLMLMVLGVAILGYGFYAGLDPIAERFAAAAVETKRIRAALWSDTLRMARDFPLLGTGAGPFEATFPAYRTAMREQVAYAHAHQDYLELAAEGGLVALGLVLIAVTAFAWRIAHGLRTQRGATRIALALLSAAVTGTLVHAAVDFPLHIPGLVYLLLLVAALALRVADGHAGDEAQGDEPHPAVRKHPM